MFDVIYENKDFIALNKPAGLLVHKTAAKEKKTLIDAVLKQYPSIKGVGDNPDRPGLVHRLDKDTSGVLVIAKNQPFFEYLKNLFQQHQVKKTYLALVWGELKGQGMIDQPIGLKPGTVKRSTRGRNLKMVKEATTGYKALKQIDKDGQIFTLVELRPKTGRTHQLRVHLASVSHPVVGDALYGKKNNPWNLPRQFLHAESLEFSMNDGRRIKIEADLPEDLKLIIDRQAEL